MPRTRLRLLARLLPVFLGVVACADAGRSASTGTADTLPPPPRGVDPRMVERRPDGVWIASADSLRRIPGYVVDSIFAPEEEMRRFRASLSAPLPTTLESPYRTPDALLRALWRGYAAGDSAALAPLALTKAEYGVLYHPESREAERGMVVRYAWQLGLIASVQGYDRAIQRVPALAAATVVRTSCGAPDRVGANTVHGPCWVVFRGPGGTDSLRLANAVLERGGRVKLVSFSNGL